MGKAVFIMTRPVNWSLLMAGFNIPIEFQDLVSSIIDVKERGESREIRIKIGNCIFDTILYNVGFSKKFRGHNDIMQVKYTSKSELARCLQSVFKISFDYVIKEKAKQVNRRKHIVIPDELLETFDFIYTGESNLFEIVCHPNVDVELHDESKLNTSYNENKEPIFKLSEPHKQLENDFTLAFDNNGSSGVDDSFKLRHYDYEACFEEYKKKILAMKRATIKSEKAIAKPVLLCSVLMGYMIDEIYGNKIYLDQRLRHSYELIYGWAHGKGNTKIEYPFYFLHNDGFWHLNWFNGQEIKTESPSTKFIEENVNYASLDNDLWFLIQNPEYNSKLFKFIRKNMLPRW